MCLTLTTNYQAAIQKMRREFTLLDIQHLPTNPLTIEGAVRNNRQKQQNHQFKNGECKLDVFNAINLCC